MKKVMFISSTGGHLTELLELKRMFKKYDYSIITEKTKSNNSLKEEYPGKVHYVMYGTRHKRFRYIFVVIANIFINLYYFLKIRPDVIVTTGAHTSVPMCLIAKLFRKKVVYIETFANIKTKTITGRIIYKFADLFIVQWESMLNLYPKATYGGWIF